MGVLINEVCCIDSSYIAETENENYHQGQIIESSGKNIYKNLENNKFYHSSLLKPLPLNEIKYGIPKNSSFQNEFKSLTQIPISNQNVIRKQSGNPLDYYDIIKKLGKGTFGTVYKVMHKKTGIIRAMKVIPKNNLKCGFTDEDIIQEINILKKLEHPHIIKLFEFYTYEKNYYLINEFCTDGDLSEKLSKLRIFPEFIVKILMIQVFNAVMYLNKNCVIHGDLKLENIMIDSFLKKDEINNTRGNKINFIQSLLEDEKEINEYLNQNELKRSSTYHNFLNKKSNFLNKIKEKKRQKNNNNGNNQYDSPDEEITQRKRGKTTIKSSLFNNKIEKKDDKNYQKKEEKKKSAFAYLNGEEDDEETEEDKKKENGINIDNSVTLDNSRVNKDDSSINIGHSSNNNIIVGYRSDEEIENGSKKMNNIKVYNENFVKNQLRSQQILKEDKKYIQNIMNKQTHQKLQSEELSCGLKKSLTLNSMKMKNFELKLIDFGCAKIFSKYKKNFKDTIGTLIYCSPEVLKNNYNKQCDIWSCGVIMYVLLSGHFPFFGKTEEEIKKKILSGKFTFNKKYFNHVSDKAKDLIKKCLIYDKNKRITAEDAVKHEFFADDINPNNIFEDEIDSKHVLISLKNYSQQSKIYQTVLAFLSHNFADKVELNKLKKIFYKIDLNLDGKLSKDELDKAYKEAGMEMKNEQLNKVIESIDFDGNGFIEYEEFIRVTLSKEKLFTEKNLKYAFDMFDLDKNGTISLNEFKEILGIKKINDKNFNKELLKEIPIQGNEEINFEQFKKILIG